VCGDAEGHTPGCEIANGLADSPFPIEIKDVDGEAHKESVYPFAGDDPEPLSLCQSVAFQQSGPAFLTGAGEMNRFTEQGAPGYVADAEFQVPCYNTNVVRLLRKSQLALDTAGYTFGLTRNRISAFALVIASVATLNAQNTAATFGQVIALGATPSDIVLDQSRQQVYLVNTAANRIDILRMATNIVVNSITVGSSPLAAAMSRDNAYLYVTNSGLPWSVSIINLSAGSVTSVSMPAQPQGVAVGADGRALVSTLGIVSGATTVDTLLILDQTQPPASQLTAVLTPPPPSTPVGVALATLPKPPTTFLSKLAPTPDGQYIVGFTNTTTLTYMFVYEVSSGSILRSRTVNGQSTVLAMSPDGSRFMAGLTLYDVATLAILGQMSNANAPFAFASTFNTVANTGGSVFSADGKTIYGAFNVTAASNPPAPTNSSTLLLSDPNNLAIQLGIRLPESILAKMVISADGTNAWSLSQSGLIYLPLSTLYSHPILSVNSTQVFLSSNACNTGLAQGTIAVSNAGAGKLTYAVTTLSSALTSSVSTGVAPSTVTFTIEPGRLTTVTRYAGTNMVTITGTGATTLQGQSFDVSLASSQAINIPPVIRVYMNYRNSDQRGLVFPVPTTPNNSAIANSVTAVCGTPTAVACTAVVDGDMGIQDIVLDAARKRVYLTNAGYNRVEVFDTVNQVFLAPISVGQLPGQMALSTDGNTLYVASLGSELIHIVDLTIGLDVGRINFPPLPRQVGGTTATTPAPLVYPQALAVGLNGLEFVMSNGSQWKVVGGTAIPRPIDTVTTTSTTSNSFPNSTTTRLNMLASSDNRYILALAGAGTTGSTSAYLYDATNDVYLSSAALFGGTISTIQGYYGPVAIGPSQAYFAIGGLFTNSTLSPIGGAASPSTPAQGSPALRNVAAVAPFDANSYVRLSMPVRANLTAALTTDARPTLELVNIANGVTTPLAVAPDNPRFTVLGTTRINVPPRAMVIDGNNIAYIITVSGLSVVPLTPGGAVAPAILARNGVLNTSGGATLNVGGFINVSGVNLASAAKAGTLPAPTVLGGSCVTFNSVPVPLLQTSGGQITAQIPTTVNRGANVVQVRSLGTGLESAPIVVTVSAATGTTAGTTIPGVADTVNGSRIGLQ
jgi:DNA-binding beta-propeller fold protein YncE